MISQKDYKILIVENARRTRLLVQDNLHNLGYESVVVAENTSEAEEILLTKPIDLLITDIRLEDNGDKGDNSGIEFAKKFTHMPRIIMTAFTEEHLELFDLPLHVQLLRKGDGFYEELKHKIERARRQAIQPNNNLTVEGDSLDIPIKELRLRPEFAKIPLEDLVLEMRYEILPRLFLEERKIRLKKVKPGQRSGVFRVKRHFENSTGVDLIVKFGAPEDIKAEYKNYLDHVQKFIGHKSTHIVGDICVGRRMAALCYMFIGSNSKRDFKLFEDAYKTLKKEELKLAIKNLIGDTCKFWYANYQDWDGKQHLNLYEYYIERLSLNSADLIKIKTSIRDICTGQQKGSIQFSWKKRARKKPVQVTMAGKSNAILLPSPLILIENAKNYQHLFGSTHWARTHGDLNSRNIFVGPSNSEIWLIDFLDTGWGPALRDVAELESEIKFKLLENSSYEDMIIFENSLIKPDRLTAMSLPDSLIGKDSFEKAFVLISYIREKAREDITGIDNIQEYYVHLYFYAVKMITGFASDRTQNERDMQCRHAMYSAAKIADRLINSQPIT